MSGTVESGRWLEVQPRARSLVLDRSPAYSTLPRRAARHGRGGGSPASRQGFVRSRRHRASVPRLPLHAPAHLLHAATLALWEDEGVSLLPSTPPLVGKRALADFMNAVTAWMGHGRMEMFDNRCHDIDAAGDGASEWCLKHQVVRLPDGKRFDGWGKLLFVLDRGPDGRWRIQREMWNQASAAGAEGT